MKTNGILLIVYGIIIHYLMTQQLSYKKDIAIIPNMIGVILLLIIICTTVDKFTFILLLVFTIIEEVSIIIERGYSNNIK